MFIRLLVKFISFILPDQGVGSTGHFENPYLNQVTSLSSFRNRTPSGSSTPIPSGAKVTRKTSGASDMATGTSRKSSKAATPTESRVPFRL